MATKNSQQPTFWHQHLEKYKASGLSRPAYCREHGLKVSQLTYYLNQFGTQNASPSESFAKVVVSSPLPSPRCCARLIVGTGIAMEFDSGIDPVWLARLVAAIGGCS